MATTDDVSLLEHVDIQQLNCLNESTDHSFAGIVAQKKVNTTSSYLLSDADEQLLLNIPFHQSVRVRSIVIKSSAGEQAPKRVKLLVNRPSIGFEDVEDAEEPEVAQILDLPEDDVKNGRPIQLRFVRFQAVNSLHIFVVSNQGGVDETRIDAVDVLGLTVETTKDLRGLKSEEHDH
ncbi:PITH domain-containing protein [Mycena albidolilacea]|uniref:PITH domain-containing protein n=1 Tax=Mycena albidolilacea TaxID=1033008 RepID=A0AAD7EUK5_9AGAR|nr:PITH domain-containing protein [Mycena albidolilacea]